MKKTVIGMVMAVGLVYAAHFVRTEADSQITLDSTKTNVVWLGSAVFGVDSPGVVGGPFPQAQKEIQIGLRADGLVVWRKTPK